MTAHDIWLVKSVISNFVLPPTIFIVLGLAGLWLLKRKPKLGKSLIALSLSLLFALSTPFVANSLMALLERHIQVLQPGVARAAQAIVVLGGGVYRDAPEYAVDMVNGITLERLQYAAYLQRQTSLPILVSGGSPEGGTPEAKMMKRTLEQDFKVPVRWTEERSLDTAQNARFSALILKAQGISKILLVSHAWHLPRARIEFEKFGLTPILAPTRFGYVPERRRSSPIFAYLPQARALLKSYYAIHEGIGIFWYRFSP